MNELFTLFNNETKSPTNSYHTFQLHVHDNYEIYLFLEGDTKYIIEENVYPLNSGDLIIIRKNQLHRTFHNSPKLYKRIILNVYPEFFIANNCIEYEKIFTDVKSDIGSKINANIVKSSGIYDAFMRLKEYSNNFTELNTTIVKCIIVEILHLLNNVNLYSQSHTNNEQLSKVIEYLNDNFTEDISLSELEKKFFISKFYLCRIFYNSTGLTIHTYLTKKRLAYAKDLIKSGISINFASERAGFKSYTAFYRAFLKEFGYPPKKEKIIKLK